MEQQCYPLSTLIGTRGPAGCNPGRRGVGCGHMGWRTLGEVCRPEVWGTRGAAGTLSQAGSWAAGCSWQAGRPGRYSFGEGRFPAGTAGLPETDAAVAGPAGHPGSLEPAPESEPGRREERSSGTAVAAAAAAAAVVGLAVGLRAECCSLHRTEKIIYTITRTDHLKFYLCIHFNFWQFFFMPLFYSYRGTASHTVVVAAAVEHRLAEAGIHLEPGTAGTPDLLTETRNSAQTFKWRNLWLLLLRPVTSRKDSHQSTLHCSIRWQLQNMKHRDATYPTVQSSSEPMQLSKQLLTASHNDC